MTTQDERELERAETWDFDHPEVREPAKAPRVVVSVAFRRDDFARVSAYAQRIGKRTSEFIREAAVVQATGRGAGTLVYGTGSAGALFWTTQVPPITRASGSPVEHPEKLAATTHG